MKDRFTHTTYRSFAYMLILALGFVATTSACTSTSSLFRKGPYLIYPGEASETTEMSVLWQTHQSPPKGSLIEWGATPACSEGKAQVKESGAEANEHLFVHTIKGLQTSQKVYYRVSVGLQTQTGSFRTAPAPDAQKAVFYAYGDTRSYAYDHAQVTKRMLADIAAATDTRQSLIFHSGDWNLNDDESSWDSDFFNRNYPSTLQMQASLPIMGARGNHERRAIQMRKYWPYSYVSPDATYYSFDYGPAHITVIDQYVDFGQGSAQRRWLMSDLSGSTKPWKIVLLHDPMFSAGGHRVNPEFQRAFMPIFTAHAVNVVIAGHNHFYARADVNGMQHLTLGGGGAPTKPVNMRVPFVKKAESTLHFMRMEIDGSKLKMTAIREDGSVIESVEVSNKP